MEQPTARQITILAYTAAGLSRDEIGRLMHLSLATVKVDLDQLRGIVGARNTTNAVAICMVRGLLSVQDGTVIPAPERYAVAA